MSELFKTAPPAVIRYFDNRPSIPTREWTQLAPHEHALAFTVAQSAHGDIIEDIRAFVRKGVVDQMPYDEAVKEIIPLLQKKGWWGKKVVIDPKTGEKIKVQLGSPARLRMIYWANVHSAHAAGEWEATQKSKEFLPWLTYGASSSERKRPLHVSWVGITLRVDDPFWRTHYPPNGWNCKCTVYQIGDAQARRLHQQYGKDKAPPLNEQPFVNKKTGEVQMVPAGIDPGWQTNPGIAREKTLSRGLQQSLDRLPEEARRKAVETLRKHAVLDYVIDTLGKTPSATLQDNGRGKFSAVIGMISGSQAQQLGSTTSIIRLSGDSAAHIFEKHGEIDGDIIRMVGEKIETGEFEYQPPNHLVVFVEEDGALYRAVVKTTRNRSELYLMTLHRSNARQRARKKLAQPDKSN